MFNKILHVQENQTRNYLSCATQVGYEIYQIQPFIKRDFHVFNASLSFAHMLYSTNILVCVGGSYTPAFKNSKYIFVWDMKTKNQLNYYLCCQPINALHVTHRHIIVRYQDHIEVLNLNTCTSITRHNTNINPVSACEVYNNSTMLAFSAKKSGVLRFWKKNKIVEFKSHISKIIAIHISIQCDYIITVSNKHIKKYSVETLALLHCVSIDHYESLCINSSLGTHSNFILLHYRNAHIIIFEISTGDVWTMYFPDIIYSVLLSSKSIYPKACIVTRTEMKMLQLRKNGILTLL